MPKSGKSARPYNRAEKDVAKAKKKLNRTKRTANKSDSYTAETRSTYYAGGKAAGSDSQYLRERGASSDKEKVKKLRKKMGYANYPNVKPKKIK